jgi:hypothetical protein
MVAAPAAAQVGVREGVRPAPTITAECPCADASLAPAAGREPARKATSGVAPLSSVASGRVWTALPPVGSRGIWIPFEGRVWASDGWAEPLDRSRLQRSGSYAGFPVYRAADRPDVVFVPVVEGGLLTPYRRTSDGAAP